MLFRVVGERLVGFVCLMLVCGCCCCCRVIVVMALLCCVYYAGRWVFDVVFLIFGIIVLGGEFVVCVLFAVLFVCFSV